MKRNISRLLLLLVASMASLSAAPMMFYGNLSGDKESPTNNSHGLGTTFVTIDPVAHTLRVEVSYGGLLGPTVTAAHIHVINGPGDNDLSDTLGPVATPTPSFPSFPAGTSGLYDQTFNTTMTSSFRGGFVTAAGGTAGQAEAALFAAIQDGRAYLNIHSGTFPGGEIRAFLAPVPEPGTIGLAAFALAGLGLARRVRRGSR